MQQTDADSVKVIIDTNALMVAEQFGVDIFGELERLGYIEWLVPAQVKGELSSLAVGADKGRDKMAARVALGLLERCPGGGDRQLPGRSGHFRSGRERRRCGLHQRQSPEEKVI